MAADEHFISCAQNGEDVVLWRALRHVERGRYVEVGANHPTESSVTRAFYDRGWSGVTVEPVQEFADQLRRERPRDTLVQAAVTDTDAETTTIHVVDGTGLSTLLDAVATKHRRAGFTGHDEVVPARRLDSIMAEHVGADDPVHFMVIDTEGAEHAVLAGLDLRRWRPWVLVVEATEPNSTTQTHEAWEPGVLAAGYTFCLFDGLSRFYVADEHAELAPDLSVPANPLDWFTRLEVVRRDEEIARLKGRIGTLTDELVRWRGSVLARWAAAATTRGSAAGPPSHEVRRLREELEATHATVSWRITAPLRSVQERRLRGWR